MNTLRTMMCVNTLRTTGAFFPSLGSFFPLSKKTLTTQKWCRFLGFKVRTQHYSQQSLTWCFSQWKAHSITTEHFSPGKCQIFQTEIVYNPNSKLADVKLRSDPDSGLPTLFQTSECWMIHCTPQPVGNPSGPMSIETLCVCRPLSDL